MLTVATKLGSAPLEFINYNLENLKQKQIELLKTYDD